MGTGIGAVFSWQPASILTNITRHLYCSYFLGDSKSFRSFEPETGPNNIFLRSQHHALTKSLDTVEHLGQTWVTHCQASSCVRRSSILKLLGWTSGLWLPGAS